MLWQKLIEKDLSTYKKTGLKLWINLEHNYTLMYQDWKDNTNSMLNLIIIERIYIKIKPKNKLI
jgi:hypothetical protein